MKKSLNKLLQGDRRGVGFEHERWSCVDIL